MYKHTRQVQVPTQYTLATAIAKIDIRQCNCSMIDCMQLCIPITECSNACTLISYSLIEQVNMVETYFK